jgi:hypothetical protein
LTVAGSSSAGAASRRPSGLNAKSPRGQRRLFVTRPRCLRTGWKLPVPRRLEQFDGIA